MLSKEDNELLTRTGPGTPMGQLLRRYWLPALLSEELPEPDGRPVRLPLLGERLVAYRDSTGAVGLLEESCPHRGASLALGRNEDGAIRCIYHGWQFDREGRCTDMPTERPGSPFPERVRAQAYPTREAAGIVWAYLGPPQLMPCFPNFLWLKLYPARAAAFKILEECNWAQALEGGLDMAHAPILHRSAPWSVRDDDVRQRNLAPRHDVQLTPYGLRYGAIWDREDGAQHVRIISYVAPWWTITSPGSFGSRQISADRVANAWVPRDDVSAWHFQYYFNPEQPIDVPWRIATAGYEVDEHYRKQRNRDNGYLQDAAAMRTESVSGIRGVITQDHAVNESQGPIVDRTKEHLAACDVAAIAMRKILLDAAKSLAADQPPPGLDPAIAYDRILSETIDAPAGVPWQTAGCWD
ncbi:MAG TPA: Rieske 2Fe-2S domain-containing protein [Chloroflexota bacterium]|nr:Rieske 2Fe-2S domain-containing protein [Chloroflexota bacterium]